MRMSCFHGVLFPLAGALAASGRFESSGQIGAPEGLNSAVELTAKNAKSAEKGTGDDSEPKN